MDEIKVINSALPQTIHQKAKYVLFGTDALMDYRAKLSAMKKAGVSVEQYNQLKLEARETGENVLLFGVDVGNHIDELPKATPNNNPFHENDPQDKFVKPKSEVVAELGFTPKQARDLQEIAKHPDIVQRVIERAREEDDIPSKSQVLKEIQAEKEEARKQVIYDCGTYEEWGYETEDGFEVTHRKPHVSNNSRDDNEWYTPVEYLESARRVLGTINLDPASNDFANERVQAEVYYTEDDDGINQDWYGNIWLNPPYSSDSVKPFAEKLVNSDFDEAIVLVNNATETEWFNLLISKASAIVFPKGRIQFDKRDGKHGSPLQGQAFIYYGDDADKFLSEFMKYGWGAKL